MSIRNLNLEYFVHFDLRIDSGNPEALADDYQQLIESGATTGQQLSLKARRRIQDNFTIQVVARHYEKLYAEIISKA